MWSSGYSFPPPSDVICSEVCNEPPRACWPTSFYLGGALSVFGGWVYFSPPPTQGRGSLFVSCASEVAAFSMSHQNVRGLAEGTVWWLVSTGDQFEVLKHPVKSRASGKSSRPPDQTKNEVPSPSFSSFLLSKDRECAFS